jgi:hypothetical protein
MIGETESPGQSADLPVVRLRHTAEITPAVDGDVRVCASIGPAGELIAVWAQLERLPGALSWTQSGGGVNFRDAQAPRPFSARVTMHVPERASVVSMPGLSLANFTVQPLPGGNILLAGYRCYWRPGGADRNAVVYDQGGRELAREVLGDGIGRVLAAPGRAAWTGR